MEGWSCLEWHSCWHPPEIQRGAGENLDPDFLSTQEQSQKNKGSSISEAGWFWSKKEVSQFLGKCFNQWANLLKSVVNCASRRAEVCSMWVEIRYSSGYIWSVSVTSKHLPTWTRYKRNDLVPHHGPRRLSTCQFPLQNFLWAIFRAWLRGGWRAPQEHPINLSLKELQAGWAGETRLGGNAAELPCHLHLLCTAILLSLPQSQDFPSLCSLPFPASLQKFIGIWPKMWPITVTHWGWLGLEQHRESQRRHCAPGGCLLCTTPLSSLPFHASSAQATGGSVRRRAEV